MAVKTKVEPVNRDIELILNEELSPQGRSDFLASFAADTIEDAKQINKRALGRVPPYTVSVDGKQGAPLNSVKPDGVIVVEFEIVLEALGWINTQLQIHSPVRSGLFAKSHELFADGRHVENPNNPPPAEEYVFLNVQPYARKIERGSSSQAPDGVYQAVATLAQKFGNTAKISFSYRSAVGFESLSEWAGKTSLGRQIRNQVRRTDWLTRQPAIIVRIGD
jgi:hypothetical protein